MQYNTYTQKEIDHIIRYNIKMKNRNGYCVTVSRLYSSAQSEYKYKSLGDGFCALTDRLTESTDPFAKSDGDIVGYW